MTKSSPIRKHLKISILLVGLPILLILGTILILPWIPSGGYYYYMKITLLSGNEDRIENPVNFTTSEVLGVPVLHEMLEEILSSETITYASRHITKEESESLTSLFDAKGSPLIDYGYFYYNNTLFEIDYIVSTS